MYVCRVEFQSPNLLILQDLQQRDDCLFRIMIYDNNHVCYAEFKMCSLTGLYEVGDLNGGNNMSVLPWHIHIV